jgi:spermidine synthase
VLVGLGGGSLVMFLHRAFPSLLSLDVVELDETVVRTAWKYFGFQERPPQLKAHVADGVTFVHDLAERRRVAIADGDGGQLQQDALDVLIIDVNNSDLSAGLSFPPEVFLSESFLQDARTCVASSAVGSSSGSGVVLFNFGCRNAALRSELLARVARVFRSVATLRPDEAHVNIVVAATDDEWNEEREENGSSSELHSSAAGSKRPPPSLSWSDTMDRLSSLQQQCDIGKKDASSSPASSDFSWSDEMELQSMLARASFVALRQGGEGANAVDLVPLFPKQKAEQEAKEEGNN